MTDNEMHQSADTTPSRRRLRYRGCLLAAMLLVGGVASLYVWIRWRGHSQEARIEYVRQLGGELNTQPAGPAWLHDLVAATLGDEHAAGFTDITYISLRNTQVSDSGLEHLSGLDDLEGLDLSNTQVSDAGLQHLSGLTNLKGLWLNDTHVSDAGLQHMRGLTALERLELRNTQLSDAGLQHLSGFTKLKGVWLENTRVTDAGADKLRSQRPETEIIR